MDDMSKPMRKFDYAVMLSTEMERSYHRNSVAVRHGIFLCAAEIARELGSRKSKKQMKWKQNARDTLCARVQTRVR
jgi:hypothetical protein